MTPEGMGRGPEDRLECPRCATKVSWSGAQFICPACTWTEFKQIPPSRGRKPPPDEKKDKPQ
jgi:hypothetical protein